MKTDTMNLPGIILALLTAASLTVGCGYCEDEGGPPGYFDSYLELRFHLADSINSYENDRLYSGDTVFPGYNYDSLTVTPLNGAPLNDLYKPGEHSSISFNFVERDEKWLDQFKDSTARLEYAIQYNTRAADTIRLEFRAFKILYRCYDNIYYYDRFKLFYNDSLAIEFDQDAEIGWDDFYPFFRIYKSPE